MRSKWLRPANSQGERNDSPAFDGMDAKGFVGVSYTSTRACPSPRKGPSRQRTTRHISCACSWISQSHKDILLSLPDTSLLYLSYSGLGYISNWFLFLMISRHQEVLFAHVDISVYPTSVSKETVFLHGVKMGTLSSIHWLCLHKTVSSLCAVTSVYVATPVPIPH